MIALVVTGLLAAAGAGVAGWLLGRRAVESRTAKLERRLALLEDAAGRKYRDRLATMRRRLGFVYLDGLPAAADSELADMFEAGARYATQAEWDKAGERWTKAMAKASPSEAVALRVLCGICRLLLSQPSEAQAQFEAALAVSREAGDRTGTAATLLALGSVAAEQGASRDAAHWLEESLHLSRRLSLKELEAAALVRLAGFADAEEQYERALGFHRQAVAVLQAAGDRAAAVRQYGAAGETLFRKGELEKARAAHEDGLLLARQLHDRLGEAERLTAIGVIHRAEGDAQRALDVLERAFHIHEEIHQTAPMARLLHELALLHEQLGEWDVAHEYHERSLELSREVGDRNLQARSLEQMAEHCLSHAAPQQALAQFEEAARIDREDARKRDLCHDLTGVGRSLLQLDRGPEAAKFLADALALSLELADQKAEAWVSLYLGRAQRGAGLQADALRILERTQALARKIGEERVLAAALAEAALVQVGLGDWSGATETALAALDQHRKFDDKREQAHDLVQIGAALRHQSRLDEAKSRIEDGIRLAHSSEAREIEARLLSEMAAVNLALGNPDLARQNLERSLALREGEGDLRAQAECLMELGRLLAGAGEYEAARARLDRAVRLYVKLDDRERAADATRALVGLPGAGGGVQLV
ncbi:tetratricopeptide repeat protein [candidate division WOR-3 bacterium]|uniref:Tetratricopeptide repeat protein n=1 Tax=candidate division WOR-3 bacterium TaxID=2052148 RepID=A0A937XF23_UNCW3|nr:tetratricopeptide repeat protein [candidate division WOR-3 bacterium]